MNRQSPFSYRCNQCGCCCHDQAITLSPVNVIAIARATGLSTSAAVARYTMRRGSLLRFDADGAGCYRDSIAATVEAHLAVLSALARCASDAATIAVAAALLAVSLGYSPGAAIAGGKA